MAGWKYSAGLSLILVVVLIWVASAEVTQDIFNAYDHPFTITWLGASLLSLLLPISWIRDRFWPKKGPRHDMRRDSTPEPEESFTFSPLTPSVDGRRREVSPKNLASRNKDIELQPLVFKNSTTSDKPEGSFWTRGVDRLRGSMKKVTQSDLWEVIQVALFMAPMWFLVEYFANASLALTSVANTTIISSSAGLWTLLFSVFLGQDKFNGMKLIAVVVTIGGVVMTTLGSSWTTSELIAAAKANKTVPDARHPTHVKQKNDNLSAKTLMGDALSLTSAICYGFFTVQLKKFAGEEGETGEEKMDVQKVFGYMGLISLVGLWWVVVPLHALGIEPTFKFPNSLRLDEYLLANGLVGSMVSDYFWALAVVWTSPVVATLGMSLTIPVAMISDVILHGRHFSSVYILGALQVFGGFCIANLDDKWMQYMGFA